MRATDETADVHAPRPASSRPRSRATRPRHAFRRAAVASGLVCSLVAVSGCGALLLVGGAGTSAIAFATGELRSTEQNTLVDLDRAVARAIDTLGYSEAEAERDENRVEWHAKTPSGDPVEIRLIGEGPEETELRIRIGVFGDEARSRLVLEQIRQSL